jgi:hypothetical protein
LIRFAERPAWSKKEEEENTAGPRIMFDHIKMKDSVKERLRWIKFRLQI